MIRFNADLGIGFTVAVATHAVGFVVLGSIPSRENDEVSALRADVVMDVVLVQQEDAETSTDANTDTNATVDAFAAKATDTDAPMQAASGPVAVPVMASVAAAARVAEWAPESIADAIPIGATAPIADSVPAAASVPVAVPDGDAKTVPDAEESPAAAPVIPPVAVANDPPTYPKSSRRRGHEGTTLLNVQVLPNGRTGSIEITDSSGHAALDRAAVRAAKKWRFEPASQDGRSVEMWIEIPVQFDLQDEAAGR